MVKTQRGPARPFYERMPRGRASRHDVAGALAAARLHKAIRQLDAAMGERHALTAAANASELGASTPDAAAAMATAMLAALRSGAADIIR